MQLQVWVRGVEISTSYAVVLEFSIKAEHFDVKVPGLRRLGVRSPFQDPPAPVFEVLHYV